MPLLVSSIVYDSPCPYFLYGGILFLPLTQPYLEIWGQDWRGSAPRQLVALLNKWREVPGEQAVILSLVYPSRETQGYADYVERRVLSVNDEKVLNLMQMYQLVQRLHASEQYI